MTGSPKGQGGKERQKRDRKTKKETERQKQRQKDERRHTPGLSLLMLALPWVLYSSDNPLAVPSVLMAPEGQLERMEENHFCTGAVLREAWHLPQCLEKAANACPRASVRNTLLSEGPPVPLSMLNFIFSQLQSQDPAFPPGFSLKVSSRNVCLELQCKYSTYT